MKLRLYALRPSNTQKHLPDLYFSDKKSAKAERDARNAKGESFVVTIGPDHHRYKAV